MQSVRLASLTSRKSSRTTESSIAEVQHNGCGSAIELDPRLPNRKEPPGGGIQQLERPEDSRLPSENVD
jgi:hypothetical protein